MRKTIVVSLDVTGTIVSREYVDNFWLEVIPREYARVHGVSLEEAKKRVFEEYDEVGEERIEWYIPEYWVKKYKLNKSVKELAQEALRETHVFEDAYESLHLISNNYKLIFSTNLPDSLVKPLLRKIGVEKYEIFSSVTHYHMIRKTRDFYRRVAEDLNVKPREIIHIGDDLKYDYIEPSSIGVKAILICRNTGRDVPCVRNLIEFWELISKLE